MKRILAVLLVVFSVACSSGSEAPSAPAPKPFAIGMVTFAGYAPLYLAKEKGYFGDLNVELKRIEEIPSIRAAVVNGDLDAYLATPDIALNSASQPPGKAVWAIDESAGGDGVVVAAGIKSLADLKGKQVAAEPGLPPYFVLMYLLHQNGLSLNDVKLRDMSTQNAAAAFASSSVDAAGLYEPYLSTSAKQRNGRVVVSSAQLPGLILDLIFASDATIETRPADVDRVIQGWRQALRFISTNRDEAFAVMAKAFNLPVGEFTDIVGGIRWVDLAENERLFATNGAKLAETMTTVVQVLQRHHPQTYATQPASIIDGSFVDRQKAAAPKTQAAMRWVHP